MEGKERNGGRGGEGSGLDLGVSIDHDVSRYLTDGLAASNAVLNGWEEEMWIIEDFVRK